MMARHEVLLESDDEPNVLMELGSSKLFLDQTHSLSREASPKTRLSRKFSSFSCTGRST